ncbi:hypothetical protein ACIG0C_03060 [Kitasatospora aureofaciens]|uniref:Uncharacterized protein n=1 Tax=Kitasatospora aureofaciens TaxID=1894 RepID=A0A1E7N891_KITAU|nr:hypothetical protein [Kitasatospora aureofaciens]ARF78638.1 hypothetical protein B6264_06665 [Kitasatospora aureofaciens]OEV36916.1 hypothetical protein HS99_0027025 [Kitasatospora aureofaciens]GGU78631.1 hypothetical protein GCM10010502_33330 [Kitasatospora aureofaciens]
MDEPEISRFPLFQSAAEALRPLARLTLDLDEVARRLGLAPEDSVRGTAVRLLEGHRRWVGYLSVGDSPLSG